MNAFFSKLLEAFKNVDSASFEGGYVVGVAFAIAIISVILALKIIVLIFFRGAKKSNGIKIKKSDGNIFVASSAIIDFAKSYERDFPSLKIDRARLFEKKSAYCLDIDISFDIGKLSLPDVEPALKEKISSGLLASFGIDSVNEVKIRVINAARAANP